MDVSAPHSQHPLPPRYTERQLAVCNYLYAKDHALGDRFVGVLHALANASNPEAVVQAAHSARELIHYLPRAFETAPVVESSDIISMLPGLFDLVGKSASLEVIEKYIENLRSAYSVRETPHRAMLHQSIAKADASQGVHLETLAIAARTLHRLYTRFVDISHHRMRCSPAELAIDIESLQDTLASIVQPYFETEAELDALLLVSDPGHEHVERLGRILVKSALIERFFSALNHTAWFPLLREAGYFDNPTGIWREEDRLRLPSWPQAAFLMKCATSYPVEIATIAETCKTDNPRVYQQFAELAALLPTREAGRIADGAAEWLNVQYQDSTLLFEAVIALATKLSSGGDANRAFALTDTLTEITIDPRLEVEADSIESFRPQPDAKSKFDDWRFGEAIKKLIPCLKVLDIRRTIELLCDKLSRIVELDNWAYQVESKDSDYSSIWRPSIEDHGQNIRMHAAKDIVLTTLRNLLAEHSQSGETEADEALGLLSRFPYPVFRRLELWLLTHHIKHRPDLVENAVRDPEKYDIGVTHREYYRLLEERFGECSSASKAVYLSWIEKGPDVPGYVAWYEKQGHHLTKEDCAAYVEDWQRDNLTPISKYLDQTWRKRYEALVKKHGPASHPGFLAYSESFTGPTSPISQSDLGKLSPIEVFEYLRTWIPTRGHFDPSPDGLGRVLAADVTSRPHEYVRILDPSSVSSLASTYLFWLLHGLEQGLKDGASLDWATLFTFCEFVAFAERRPDPPPDQDDFDTHWSGVEKSVGSLVSKALQASKYSIPITLREQVWRVIERLTHADEPSVQYETQYGGSNIDPATLSINTARGTAAHAMFQYMIWVDNSLNLDKPPAEKSHSIPTEVLPTLNRFVNPATEPTETVRSAVGWHLNLLCFLNPEWVRSHATDLLPDDEALRPLRDAIHQGFFSFSDPLPRTFTSFRELYETAFHWAIRSSDGSDFHRPKEHFAEHLMAFYWFGHESLEGDRSLLHQFFQNASPEARANAISFIGRNSGRIWAPPPQLEMVIKRLQELWDWRLNVVHSAPDPIVFAQELGSFGWWVSEGNFDPAWTLMSLKDAILLTGGKIENTHGVLKRLLYFVDRDAVSVAEILAIILDGQHTSWEIGYWDGELRSLFSALKASGNGSAWEICRLTINTLGERGNRQFGDFL